jgi:hypothetical protein
MGRPGVFDILCTRTGRSVETLESGRVTFQVGLLFSSMASGDEAQHRPGADRPRHPPAYCSKATDQNGQATETKS